jgi:iron-regulated transporter 1
MAVQNLFELFSFASTIAFPHPQQFRYPIFISYGAIVVAAACFAAFVRQKRGHLLHASRCMKREKYHPLDQAEQGAMLNGDDASNDIQL